MPAIPDKITELEDGPDAAPDDGEILAGDGSGSYANQSAASLGLVTTGALTTALASYAPLASPAFTSTPTAPTAAQGTNTTQIATTAFVRAEVAALVASAPTALDTLDELAAALGDDANFAATVTNALAGKLTASENLNDLTDVAAARAVLDVWTISEVELAIGDATANVQPLDATLTALAGQNWAANAFPIGSGADALAQVSFAANTFPARASTGNLVAKAITDFGLSLVDDANAAAGRSTLAAAGTGAANTFSAAQTISFTDTSTSGTVVGGLLASPTYNQTSGTASTVDHRIVRTNTALGSGTHKFCDFLIGSTSYFSVTTGALVSAGNATVGGEFRSYQNGTNYVSMKTDVGALKSGFFRDNADFILYYDLATGDVNVDSKFNGSSSVRLRGNGTENFRVNATGVGFYGGTPAAKQTVTGSRGGNAALASLLTALANIGLITDSSS